MLSKRTSKLQKKPPSALKREHPHQNMTFLNFFLLLWVIFALLDSNSDADSEYGSGATTLVLYLVPDPDLATRVVT